MFFPFFVGVFLFYAYSVFVSYSWSTRWAFKRARNHLNRWTYTRENEEKRRKNDIDLTWVRSPATPIPFKPVDGIEDMMTTIFAKETASIGGSTTEKNASLGFVAIP